MIKSEPIIDQVGAFEVTLGYPKTTEISPDVIKAYASCELESILEALVQKFGYAFGNDIITDAVGMYIEHHS